jgi:hypothetical protein
MISTFARHYLQTTPILRLDMRFYDQGDPNTAQILGLATLLLFLGKPNYLLPLKQVSGRLVQRGLI